MAYIDSANIKGTLYELQDTQARTDIADLKSAISTLNDEEIIQIPADVYNATIQASSGLIKGSSSTKLFVFELYPNAVYSLQFVGGNVRRYGFSNSGFSIDLQIESIYQKSGTRLYPNENYTIINSNGYKYLYCVASSVMATYPASLSLYQCKDANATLNIMPLMISRAYRDTLTNGYRFQSIAYNSNTGVYYIGCSSPNKDGTSKILVSNNLFDLHSADQYNVIAGHINSMAYDAINDRLLVVSGNNEDGVAEDPPGGNTVIIIDPSTMTVSNVVALQNLTYAISLSCIGNTIYVYDGTEIYTYDLNFNLLSYSIGFSTTKNGAFIKSLSMIQDMCTDGTYLYLLLNDSRDIQPRGTALLSRINPKLMYVDKIVNASINTGAEAEGCVIVDGNLYIACDGAFVSVNVADIEHELISTKPTRILPNTDLNNLLAFGKWFCSGADVCRTLSNLPPDGTIALAFSLENIEQGPSWTRQILKPSSFTNANYYCAVYERFCNNNGQWGSWTKSQGTVLS